MARKTQDVIEDEVRRRYADLLASAGVDSGRLSLEILYLLPAEFVREYIELFWEALREDLPGTNMAMGKDEGQIKAKAGKKVRHRRKEDGSVVEGSDRGAQAGGKKYKVHWLIRSEEALEVKNRVDRKLVRLIGTTRRDVRAESAGEKGRGQARGSNGRFGKKESG